MGDAKERSQTIKMEILEEKNSDLSSARDSKVFESVWIPKSKMILLEFDPISCFSKIESFETNPQFEVTSVNEQIVMNYGTRMSSPNLNRDFFPYLHRRKKDGWFAPDLIQSRKGISNQSNRRSDQTNEFPNQVGEPSIQIDQPSSQASQYLMQIDQPSVQAGQSWIQVDQPSIQVGQSSIKANQSSDQAHQSSDQANQSSDQANQSSDQANQSSDQTGQSSDQTGQSSDQTGQSSTQVGQSSIHANQFSDQVGQFSNQVNLQNGGNGLRSCMKRGPKSSNKRVLFRTHLNRYYLLPEQNCDSKASNQYRSSKKHRRSSKVSYYPKSSKILYRKLSRDPKPSKILYPKLYNQAGSFENYRGCDSRSLIQSVFLENYTDHSKDYGSRQDGGLAPSHKDEFSGKCWDHSNVPGSTPNRDAESPSVQNEAIEAYSKVPKSTQSRYQLRSNQDHVDNTNRSLGSPVPSHELESSVREGENDEGLDSVSNGTQSSDQEESWKETSSSSDSSEFGRKKKKSTKKGAKKIGPREEAGRSKMSRKFRCTTCGNFFESAWHLKKHVDVHQEDLLYRCRYCGKRCYRSKRLKDHLKVHKKEPGPHFCQQCGWQFSRKLYLDRHLQSCPGSEPFQT